MNVSDIRFLLHSARSLQTSVCLQLGCMHNYLHRSAFIVRAPVPVLGHIQSFQVGAPSGLKRTQVISGPRHPWDLRPAGLSRFSPPGTLGTGRTPSFQHPRYRWGLQRDSVLSRPQVPWRLAGLSPFSPPGTLGTGETPFSLPGTLMTGGTVVLGPQAP